MRQLKNTRASGTFGNQQGSAMMFALMGLVFLTVIGLSLAVVTETEMLIGTNEQITQETFYAAEAGVAAAVSQLLVTNDTNKKYFALLAQEGDLGRAVGAQTLGYAVDFASVYPVAFDVAPFTKANEGSAEKHYSGFFRTTVRARRLAWPNNQDVPDCYTESQGLSSPAEFQNILAEKVLTVAFFASPLPQIEGGTVSETFEKPDDLGCAPETEDDATRQTLPPP